MASLSGSTSSLETSRFHSPGGVRRNAAENQAFDPVSSSGTPGEGHRCQQQNGKREMVFHIRLIIVDDVTSVDAVEVFLQMGITAGFSGADFGPPHHRDSSRFCFSQASGVPSWSRSAERVPCRAERWPGWPPTSEAPSTILPVPLFTSERSAHRWNRVVVGWPLHLARTALEGLRRGHAGQRRRIEGLGDGERSFDRSFPKA